MSDDFPQPATWEDSEGKVHRCSHRKAQHEEILCDCEKYRDAVVVCRLDREVAGCPSRQDAQAECNERALPSTTTTPIQIRPTVSAVTDARETGETSTRATPQLVYPGNATSSIEPTNAGRLPGATGISPTEAFAIGGGILIGIIGFAYLGLSLWRRFQCWLNQRPHDRDVELGTVNSSSNSTVSTTSADVAKIREPEAAVPLTAGATTEESESDGDTSGSASS